MDTHTKFPCDSQRSGPAVSISARVLQLLRLVAEERALRLDLAAPILGLQPSALVPIAERALAQGLLEQERFLVRERYPWIWPTRPGLRASGTGYPFYYPSLGQLQHMAGVAATRFVCIKANPGAVWVPERALMREHSRRKRHLADGVFEIDGRRTPVEVELTRKDRYKLVAVMKALLEAYGAAHYYCSRSTRGAVAAALAAEGLTEVEVFDVPSFL